jgi:hypothetical protein
MLGFMRNSRNQEEDSNNNQADLECEEAIIKDKQRFGRTRTHLMRHLRAKYGSRIADRAMWRVNKRSIQGTNLLFHNNSQPDSAL